MRKFILTALMAAGLWLGSVASSNAGVHFGVYVGGPGYYYPPPYYGYYGGPYYYGGYYGGYYHPYYHYHRYYGWHRGWYGHGRHWR